MIKAQPVAFTPVPNHYLGQAPHLHAKLYIDEVSTSAAVEVFAPDISFIQ